MAKYSEKYSVEQESKRLHDELRLIAQDAEDNEWSNEDRNKKMLKKIKAWQIGTRIVRVLLSVLATVVVGLGWILIAVWQAATGNS